MSAGGADAAYVVFEAVCMLGAAAMLCLAGFAVWRLIKLRRGGGVRHGEHPALPPDGEVPGMNKLELAKGMAVRVRRVRPNGSDWANATVALVSGNGNSIALLIDGGMPAGDGYVLEALPLLYEDGKYQGLLGVQDEYELELNPETAD